MPAGDDDLADEIAGRLQRRPGWTLEPQTTPGAPPLWCYGPAGHRDLTVGPDDGKVSVYLVDADRELLLPGADALVDWLDHHEADF